MRRVKLPELLIEVDNELGFTRHFLTPAQRQAPEPEDICTVLAAVMAHDFNPGAYTMAQLTPNVTYEQLKRIAEWQLTEGAQRSAVAEFVGAITALDTSSRWGEGRTAASDGQRFSLPHRVLQQTYSTRLRDFALEFYTFGRRQLRPLSTVCPSSAPTATRPSFSTASCITRASLRLRSITPIPTATLSSTSPPSECWAYGCAHTSAVFSTNVSTGSIPIASMVHWGRWPLARIAIDIDLIAEQWDRRGQLYASLKTGHITASVALKRLVAFQRQESILSR
jgi:hypothetical protein